MIPQKHPQEIEVWYILPAIRKELVRVFKTKGKNGKEIAGLLGLTPAAVSQYGKDKRGGAELPQEVRGYILECSEKITNSKTAYREIQNIVGYIKETKALCKIHLLFEDELDDCDVCYV